MEILIKLSKKMPSYRVPIEDEVFRSMKVDNFSKTPYSDATQVSGSCIWYLHPHQNYLSDVTHLTKILQYLATYDKLLVFWVCRDIM